MLSNTDRRLVEEQRVDPHAEVSFEAISGCLVWSDEIPARLSADGREYVRDLIAARGYIHRGVPTGAWTSPDPLQHWNEALGTGLRWNGFRRVALTQEERQYLETNLADDTPL